MDQPTVARPAGWVHRDEARAGAELSQNSFARQTGTKRERKSRLLSRLVCPDPNDSLDTKCILSRKRANPARQEATDQAEVEIEPPCDDFDRVASLDHPSVKEHPNRVSRDHGL